MSEYKTVEGQVSAEIVEKKSRFIATLCHVESEDEALAFIDQIRTEHAQARHNVYAYILRGGRIRYTDDGEPSQTAGIPTMETLQHAGLEDVACVVTRYFGGVLLGTGGLVRAYTQAVQASIEVAHVVDIASCVDVEAIVPYPLYEQVVRLAVADQVRIMQTDYTDKVTVRFRALAQYADALVESLVDLLRGKDAISATEPFESKF